MSAIADDTQHISSSSESSSPSVSIKGGSNNNSNKGLTLRWSRIHKYVQVKESNAGLLRGSIAAPSAADVSELNNNKKKDGGPIIKTILDDVSGFAAPGEVLAMMGPSGSGKTSLLNCLSGRTGYDSGTLTVNGKPLTPNGMKRLMAKIAYVRQADIFFTHLTVRDQLGYTAFLRLPQAWPKQRKLDEVERIMKLLRLNKVADSKISLLSGGEKKRVNIGTELLTDPSCLLLDEPTSGLDSTNAVALMQMLQTLARKENKTVITSIHQPNSALFFSFDRLVMLAEGNVVYFGKPRASLRYLRDRNLTCPDGYNAADHWMDLLVQDSTMAQSTMDFTTELGTTERLSDLDDNNDNTRALDQGAAGAMQLMQTTARQQLIEAWDNEAQSEQIDLATQNLEEETTETSMELPLNKYNTSWWAQYCVLVHRALKNSRSAIFTPLNLIKSAALGIVVGLTWFQTPYTESTVFDRSSFFFFTMTYWVFDAMFTALMAFPSEREVILKERSSGSYHLGAYFLAKTTSEMPTRLTLPSLYMIIGYWMAGINPRFDLFIYTTLISLLSVVAGEALGLMIGASIYDMEQAMTVMTVFSLALMLLGGFFVQNVPVWLDWGKYFSPFKYSFDASLRLVFDKPVPCDGSGALESLCGGRDTGTVSVDEVMEFLNIQGSLGFNVGLLLAIGLVPRFIAYLALRAKKEGDR